MINFRNTNIFFVALLVLCVGYHIFRGLPAYVYVLLVFTYSLILCWGSYFIRAGFYIRSLCSAKTNQKEIAISFDDGPAKEYTAAILDILRQHHVEAAFFCIGNRIAGNELLFRSLHEQGHIIGNHSYSHHKWFDLYSSQKMLADMQAMDKIMKKEMGLSPRLFRPPYGVTNPNLSKAIRQGNYISVGWNIRSFDTVIKDEEKLFRRVSKSVRPGAIILFHDTNKTTLAILPAFIKQLLAEGYAIKRLDKMLNLNPYA